MPVPVGSVVVVFVRILTAGLEAFAKHGFVGATTADIAQRAGHGGRQSDRYHLSKGELFDNERAIRSAVATFRRYRVGGLGALASGVVAEP